MLTLSMCLLVYLPQNHGPHHKSNGITQEESNG